VASRYRWLVIPGAMPGIHVFVPFIKEDVNGRDERGHDNRRGYATSIASRSRLASSALR
jgi:hypothetical protein